MMKRIIIFLLMVLPIVVVAQNDTTKYYKSNDYGWTYQRLKTLKALIPPTDTTTNKLGLAVIGWNVYVGNGASWSTVVGGGGSFYDSVLMASTQRLKDTAAVLRAYGESLAATKISSTRTLTINGVSYDLSSNRSWTVGTVTQSQLNDTAAAIRAAIGGGGSAPGGSATELQYRSGPSTFGAITGSSYDATNRKLTLSKTTSDSALLVFDGDYIGSKTFMKVRPPVKNDSVPEWHFISQVNANADLTYTNHVLKIRPWAKDKNKYYGIGDEWEGRWKTGGATYFERHIEFHHHYNSENARLLSFTTISRDSMGNSQSQLDIRGNTFQLMDLKNNAYFYVNKNGNYTGVNAQTELIGLNPYHRLTDETAPTVNYSLIQQSGIDLNIQSGRNISFSSRQSFKNLYFIGMQLQGDAGLLTSSANWGPGGLLAVNPTHASTGVARFQHTGSDALWILNNRRILVNSSTDNGIGQMQINGKLTIATVDSTSVPTNGSFLFADPTTGEIKRAVPPGGGSGITGSLTSGRIPKATGTTTLGDGLIRDNGSGIGIGGASVANNMLDVQGGNSRFDLYDAGVKYGELTVETPAGTENLHVRLRRTASSGLAKWFFSVDASNTDRYWLSLDNGTGEMAHEFSTGGWYPTWKFGGTERMRLNSNGELQIGSSTDQGAFTLQNTGGLYQNGAFSLRGTNASSSPYSILFKQSDSSVSQLAFTGSTSDYLRADGTFATPPGGSGLPSQTGNAGKYLTTDGTNASWATVSGGGATDLSTSYSASDVTVASSTGLDATINAATTSNAGVMSAAMKVKLDSTITSITLSQDSITVFKRADGTEAFRDTLTTFYFVKSIVEVGGNQAQLVNDETAPGNNEYYGTDGTGTKGFFANVDGMTDYHNALEALGSTHKAQTVGFPLQYCNTSSNLTDNQIRYTAVYLNKAQTLTGVKVYVRGAGNYTGDQTNAVALYSYSGGTMTKVAESANTATLWTSAANAIQTIAFSSTYAAQPGIYYVGILYNNSAQTTAPALATGTALNNAAMASLDFTNSAKLYGTVATQNSFPATQAMSGVTGATAPTWVAVY